MIFGKMDAVLSQHGIPWKKKLCLSVWSICEYDIPYVLGFLKRISRLMYLVVPVTFCTIHPQKLLLLFLKRQVLTEDLADVSYYKQRLGLKNFVFFLIQHTKRWCQVSTHWLSLVWLFFNLMMSLEHQRDLIVFENLSDPITEIYLFYQLYPCLQGSTICFSVVILSFLSIQR